jgi:Cu(I)/Ag(I) efflux system membrane fusion protein
MFHFFILSLIACSADEPKTALGKNVIITSTKVPEKKMDDYSTKSFTCCDTKESSDLLAKYLELTRAMAADSDQKTKKAVEDLSTLLKQAPFVEDNSLTEFKNGVEYWKTLSRKEIQEDFKAPSQTFIDYAKKHTSDKGTQVIKGFCPMANNNSGGHWLQTEKIISNPYFGSMMLTCGVFE